MSSWILMRVEDGEVSHWDAGGGISEGFFDYIKEGDDMKLAITEHPTLNWFLENGPEVFMILFTDVSQVVEEGYWDYWYGYQHAEAWAEPGPAAIVEHDFDPADYGLVSGLANLPHAEPCDLFNLD